MSRRRRLSLGRTRAFTLIELLIVVAIIAIIAAIAIPSVLSSRIISYETAAAASLRSLVNAQSTFVTRCVVDQDGDGSGEYGFFRELTGIAVPRTRTVKLPVGDVFSVSFGALDANGVVTKGGYCYRMYLPTAGGPATTEAGGLPAPNPLDANNQETRWACYAWPIDYPYSGYRCFVVNQQGEVHQASNEDPGGQGIYSGPGDFPAPGAALVPNGSEDNLDSKYPLPNGLGADGQRWAQVGGG